MPIYEYKCQACGSIFEIFQKISDQKLDSTACKVCNQKKGDSSPEEAGMYLIKSPKRPNRIHFFQHYVRDRQEDWRPYLFMEPF